MVEAGAPRENQFDVNGAGTVMNVALGSAGDDDPRPSSPLLGASTRGSSLRPRPPDVRKKTRWDEKAD